MDTRLKITGAETQPAIEPAKVISGFFDPLTAAHIARMRELAPEGGLTVLVSSPPEPLLPLRARAELLAGLKMVASVVPIEDPAAVPHSFAGLIVAHEEQGDLERRQALMNHVLERQQS